MFLRCRGLQTGWWGGTIRKNDLVCSIISSKSTPINGVFECVTIELKLANCRHVVIACVYRAPGSDITLFCDNIDCLFNQVAIKKTI